MAQYTDNTIWESNLEINKSMEDEPESTTAVDSSPIGVTNEETTEDAPAEGAIPDYSMSKNQMKRRMKNSDWKERRMVKRLKEREKKKMKKKQDSAGPVDDGQVTIKKRRMTDPEASDIRVAIDCTFDDLMNDLEIKKLCKQIQRCYSENRNIQNRPFQMYICGLAGRFEEISKEVATGYKSWDVHWKTDGPEATFGKENIVYLSSESPNMLTELRSDQVYIIGGLVDHNHHKGHCFSLAEERGWKHAQLPISDYVKLRDRKVLTINHVFEILLAFIKTKDWKEAFLKILPQRKVAAVKNQSDAASGDEVKGERSEDGNLERSEPTEEEITFTRKQDDDNL